MYKRQAKSPEKPEIPRKNGSKTSAVRSQGSEKSSAVQQEIIRFIRCLRPRKAEAFRGFCDVWKRGDREVLK